MSIRTFFKKFLLPEQETPPQRVYFDYDYAEKCIDEAARCLDRGEGLGFVDGMMAGYFPLSKAVSGNHSNYSEVMEDFAKQTKDDPESQLRPLAELADKMKDAPACGLRFVVAHLILAYGTHQKFPEGGLLFEKITRQIGMSASAAAILKAAKPYYQRSS